MEGMIVAEVLMSSSPTEQAQVEDFTNLELDQGKPWCI
jgi:hypothetical protein